MIELKGSLQQGDRNKVLPVLVQFDGDLLHVWHLADPFYRLLSSDDFSIMVAGFGRPGGVIKTPSSHIHIETDDLHALQELKKSSDRLRRETKRKSIKLPLLFIAAAMICLLIGMVLVQLP